MSFLGLMGNGNSSAGGGAVCPWQLEVHKEHAASINCMALSDDQEGSTLATGSDDCSARVWSTTTAQTHLLATLGPDNGGHSKYITSLAVSDGFVYTASADRLLKKWDISTQRCVHTYEGHTGQVNRVIVTGDFVFSSSYDGTARCWSVEAEGQTGPGAVDGEGDSGCLRVFRGHSKAVYPMVFVPADDDWRDEDPDVSDALITGSGDGTARAWSIETAECVQVFGRHQGAVQCLAVDAEGRLLFTGTSAGELRSWDIATGDSLKNFGGGGLSYDTAHEMAITGIAVAAKFLFTASADRTAKSWVTEFGDSARTFAGHKHSVGALLIHQGILYTACGDGQVRAFEAKSGILRRLFRGHSHTVSALKIANEKLFSASFDGSLRVWTLDGIRTATNPHKPKGGSAATFQPIDIRDKEN